MTYTPTEQELIEIGMTDTTDGGGFWEFYEEGIEKTVPIVYEGGEWKIWKSVGDRFPRGNAKLCTIEIYPYSKSDIETLIRLFTK